MGQVLPVSIDMEHLDYGIDAHSNICNCDEH